jgi:hypothetical protein
MITWISRRYSPGNPRDHGSTIPGGAKSGVLAGQMAGNGRAGGEGRRQANIARPREYGTHDQAGPWGQQPPKSGLIMRARGRSPAAGWAGLGLAPPVRGRSPAAGWAGPGPGPSASSRSSLWARPPLASRFAPLGLPRGPVLAVAEPRRARPRGPVLAAEPRRAGPAPPASSRPSLWAGPLLPSHRPRRGRTESRITTPPKCGRS